MNKIFVSSTFSDMHAERDMVKRIIEPELRKEARRNFSNLEMIDLRWGVDTTDMSIDESARHIVRTCIAEVSNCNPYMLIFLGERYGTIYKKDFLNKCMDLTDSTMFKEEEYSLTAVEIEMGLLSEKYGNIKDCVVCIRNPIASYIEDPDYKGKYCEVKEKNISYLEKLKNRLLEMDCKLENIIFYDAAWDNYTNEVTNLNVNGQPLENVIIEKFMDIFKATWEEMMNLSVFDRAQRDGIQISQNYNEKFWGRQELIDKCVNILNEDDLLIIQGKEGTGKSALVARIANILCKDGYLPFYFWGGTGSYISNGYELYLHTMEFIKNNQGKKLLLCVDGVDRIVSDDYVGYLKFLPKLGNDIKAIISFKENKADAMLGGEKMIKGAALLYRKYQFAEVGDLDEETINEIASGFLRSTGKDLNPNIKKAILDKDNKTVLFLRLLLKRMEIVDGIELERLTDNDKLNEYFVAIIKSLPENINDLTEAIVDLSIRQMGINGFIREAISLIASSRNGLRQDDIYRMLCDEKESDKAIVQKDFSLLRNYLDIFFNEDSNGIITLRHEFLKNIFNVHVTDRAEHENKDLILHYMRNELPKEDILRAKDEFYYVMDMLDRRYHKYAMQLMLDISKTKSTTQLYDFKYYGWHSHGKKYHHVMDSCFEKLTIQQKEQFLLFLVNEYFELYDGSANEQGQLQELYTRILGNDYKEGYAEMIPGGLKQDYIRMKSQLIIGYIMARRGGRTAIGAKKIFISILENSKIITNINDSEKILIDIRKMLAGYKDVSLETDSHKKRGNIIDYEYEIRRIFFETGVQYLIICDGLDIDSTNAILEKIQEVGLDHCSNFIKDVYVILKIFEINNRSGNIHDTGADIKKMLDQLTSAFEENHSIRALMNLLLVYNAYYDTLIKLNDEKSLQEWKENAAYLLTPYIGNSNEFLLNKILKGTCRRLRTLGLDIKKQD